MLYTQREIQEVRTHIGDIIYARGEHADSAITMAAYLLFLAAKKSLTVTYHELMGGKLTDDPAVLSAAKYLLTEKAWEALQSTLLAVPVDLFKAVALQNTEDTCSTPESIIQLALALLSIKDGDNVADIGCGSGNFLTTAAQACPQAVYYGCDINAVAATISNIRSDLLARDNSEIKIDIQNYDAFALKPDLYRSFDRVFSNYPFNLRVGHAGGETYFSQEVQPTCSVRRVRSLDWLYNHLAVQLLSDDGKAVVIMTDGGLFNSLDREIRTTFVRNGWIEAVIRLPERLFRYTSLNTNLVILSKRNRSIRFVDASAICQKERRYNWLSDADIEQIVSLMHEDGVSSECVDLKTVMQNEAILTPSSYLHIKDDFVQALNPTPLSQVTEQVLRGAPITANEQDRIASQEPTDYQILMLANIQDGMVEPDLPYISEVGDRSRRYALQDGDLIVSKMTAPIKTAVVRVPKGKTIVANGNLYVLRLKQDRILPYYLQAYFASRSGQDALNAISTGTVIKNISVDALRKLEIPLLEMDVQQKIADAFEASLQELRMLENRKKRIISSIPDLFGTAVQSHGGGASA